ncbi:MULTISPECIES: carbohydrate ABC transporter permease [Chelativorans]|jgi:multiple sugar transport system permease protein|uniref:Carbohydrate ABC transporter membrane protein 1, CUT1 family n=1 Tax=Chelativorans sp. (strain BNC1) TaxID=266779 RepID=Q11BT5_CHESB|nr:MULTISPECIES: sugar ABC transporter permease [Chelativorans]
MLTNRFSPYALLAPALIIALGISFYPAYYAVDISLHRTSFFQKLNFVGLDNYRRLFLNPEFAQALVATMKFTFGSVVLIIPMGLAFALLLNQPIRFSAFFRTVLILPWALSQSVTAMLWMWILNPSYGPGNFILEQLGLPSILFLSEPNWTIWIVTAVNAWMSYPLPMVLFLAALQTVPKELYDAAQIDGCSGWRQIWHISIPWIKSTIMTTLIVMTLQVVNMVTLLYVMTGGGPLGTTQTLSLFVFEDGFFNFKLASAACAGVIIFVLNIIFSMSYIRVLRQSHMEER